MALTSSTLTTKHLGLPLAKLARARGMRSRTAARQRRRSHLGAPWSERDTTKGGW